MKVDMNNRESDVQIEILPMIDVIFCILTFFILAAVGLSRQQAVELSLPSVNDSTPVTADSSKLLVSISRVGQIYIGDIPIASRDLPGYLIQHQQLQPNGPIILHADRDARYEDVLRLLELLRSIGGDRVALGTKPNAASLDPTQGNNLPTQNQQPGQPPQPGDLGQPIPGAGNTLPNGTSSSNPPSGFPAGSTPPGGIRVPPAPAGGTPNNPNVPPGSGGTLGSPNAPAAPPADISPATP